MKQAMETIKKYMTMGALIAWATISFLALCAEDTSTLGAFIAVKAAALLSIALSFRQIKRAERAGKFPDFWYANDNDEL